jgi:ATP-binding cassette subfamily C exporter for protease/lipase
LLQTLRMLKSQGVTVILITHRTSVLVAVDRMLILRDGMVQAYGPRDEVLAALNKAREAQQPPQARPALAAAVGGAQ